MGTKAVYGFKKNGQYKVTLRKSDGYLEDLGKDILETLQKTSIEELNKIFDNIKLVDENVKPTKEQIEKYSKYKNDFYADHLKLLGEPMSWFSLIDLPSGKFKRYAEGLDVMVDEFFYFNNGEDWEFKYLIDLDDNTLNIYQSLPYIELKKKKEAKEICKLELKKISEYINLSKMVASF